MTNLPPDPTPDDQQPFDDEGSMGFLLGPRDKPDGTPIEWTTEDIRRFKALKHHVERLAKQHGLEPEASIEVNPASVSESERSKEIAKASDPPMADAAVLARMQRQTLEIEQPDGSKIKATKTDIEIGALRNLSNALKRLARLKKLFNWSGRLRLRVGRWLKATVSASNDEGEGKA